MARALHIGKVVLFIVVLYIMVNIMTALVLYTLGFPSPAVALASVVLTVMIAWRSWDRIAR